jgi:hypothetical protein
MYLNLYVPPGRCWCVGEFGGQGVDGFFVAFDGGKFNDLADQKDWQTAGGDKPKTKEERWIDEYNRAIDDALETHGDLIKSTGMDKYWGDPLSMPDDVYYQYQGIVDTQFCKVVSDCLDAFKYFYASAASILISSPNGDAVDDNESANLVRDATKRQLDKGWDKLMNDHLNQEQRDAYQKDLDEGRYRTARRWLGTALHNAVAQDLRDKHGDRFNYYDSRRPDFHDTKTGTRVELTTRLGFVGHVARGGMYQKAVYVLYKGVGRLPSVVGGVVVVSRTNRTVR